MSSPARSIIRSYCGVCNRRTNHAERAAFVFEWELDFRTSHMVARGSLDDGDEPHSPEQMIDGVMYASILQCNGCDDVSFRKRTVTHGDRETRYDPGRVETYPRRDQEQIETYPRRAGDWPRPGWLKELEADDKDEVKKLVALLLLQIYDAYDRRGFALVVMGIRAALENLIVRSNGEDKQSFAENLRLFRDKGFISERDRENLKRLLDLGSAVIHRGAAVSQDNAEDALRMTEMLIENVMFNNRRSERLKQVTPERHSR